MRHALVLVSCLLISTLAAAPLHAQASGQKQAVDQRKQHDKELDGLFAKLKVSTSGAEAQRLTKLIWARWYQSGDGDVDLLMGQARHTLRLGQHQAAIELVDEVLELAPKYAEAWNLRALILFNMGRDAESLGDLNRTLALEPRHFGALTGMAHLSMRAQDWTGALKALRAALKIHPFLNERKLIPKLEKLAREKDL